MTVKELKEVLANVPDDVVVALDFGGCNAIEAQESEFDDILNIFYIA